MGAAAAVVGGVNAAMSVNQAIQESKNIKAQGKYQKMLAEQNTKFAEMNADDALKRGDEEAKNIRKQGKRTIGSQRAALAAQGIEVNDGSALDVQLDTAQVSAVDSMTAKNNAWREAWGYKVEAINATAQGSIALATAKSKANTTLITGGINAFNQGAQGAQQYKNGK